MSEIDANGYGDSELGPEITGTVIVGGRRTATGRLYPMKLLKKIAADPTLQRRIKTLTFIGQVSRPGDFDDLNLRKPAHLITYLGVEEKELRVATRLIPTSFPDPVLMRIISEAHKVGTAVFTPVGHGAVDSNGIVGVGYELERVDLVLLDKHDVDLPERYVPKSLGIEEKQVHNIRPVSYGVGVEYRPGEFGMTHGVVADVKDMLEVVPDDSIEVPEGSRFCLIRFNSDGTDQILYVWRDRAWYRETAK